MWLFAFGVVSVGDSVASFTVVWFRVIYFVNGV